MNLVSAYIFDMDGTLSLMNGRDPMELSKVFYDIPNIPIVRLFKDINGFKIILTSIDESCKTKTEKWLKKHGIIFDLIIYRKKGDIRHNHTVKIELYNMYIKDNYNIITMFEDQPMIVNCFRELGLAVLQVNSGDEDKKAKNDMIWQFPFINPKLPYEFSVKHYL